MTVTSFILQFVRKQRRMFLAILILSFMWTFEMLFWPYFLRKVVDLLDRFDTDRLHIWPLLQPWFLWGAILWIGMEFGFRFRGYLQALNFPKMEADIRMTMFDHVQHHSPKYFNEHFAGSLSNKIGDMVASVSLILRNGLVLFLPACI